MISFIYLFFQMDKFQLALAKGNDGKTYVLFLYEAVGTFTVVNAIRVGIFTFSVIY